MKNATRDVKFSMEEPPRPDGFFSGHAAIFEKVDSLGDIIVPGAFSHSLAERSVVPILWSHNIMEPIGLASCNEDSRGLAVKAQLNMEVKRAQEIRSLMIQGAVCGLSIGYQTIKEGQDKESNARLLKKIKLWEISPCVFSAQGEATIEAVKSADPTNIGELIDQAIMKMEMFRIVLRANILKADLEELKSNLKI